MTDQPKRILLVDDEVDISEFLKECLKRAGYAVEVSNDPQTALGRLLTEEFDVVISDIRMPIMSGLDMMRLVKAEGKAVKGLIFLTGNASDDDLAKEILDLDGFLLTKPVTGQKLREVVAQVIKATSPEPVLQKPDHMGS